MTGPNGSEETATQRLPAVSVPAGAAASGGPTSALATPLAQASHELCPVCGAALAHDQRYCVECGQRLAPARLPFAQGDGQPSGPPPSPPRRRPRFQAGANATLIAGIFTLLLAMGVGVLIGKSQSSASKGGPIQYVTGVATSSTQTQSATTTSSTRSGKEGESKGAASAASSKPSKVAVKASNPTASYGSTGSGQGYQHGHFTGHFFGSEGETEESEEAGEAEEEPSSKGKK